MNLDLLANPKGTFTIVAFDHRRSLAESLNSADPDSVPAADLVAIKRLFLRYLADIASAILIDPVYGLDYGLDLAKETPPKTGILMSLENSAYDDTQAGRLTTLLPHWGVADIKAHGAAAKLLLYYHPHSPIARKQLDLVKTLSQECRRQQVIFLVEPIIYGVGEYSHRDKTDLTLISIDQLSPYVDLLKLEFPVSPHQSTSNDWHSISQEISRHATVPWIFLSRGMDYPAFKTLTTVVCEQGASGIAVGRAVWQEIGAIAQDNLETDSFLPPIGAFLENVARPRFLELIKIVESSARPWTNFHS
jgi:tagatose-1,6-bisphosphate aldolase